MGIFDTHSEVQGVSEIALSLFHNPDCEGEALFAVHGLLIELYSITYFK